MTRQEFVELVHNTRTPQITVGEGHRFIDIWIVVVNDRLFCRRYYFRENSWYDAFVQGAEGAIKCGDTVINVRGVVPANLDEINPLINEAYVDKYDKRFNHYPETAHEMGKPKYMKATLELVPLTKD